MATEEDALREKLRKIEALFAGAATSGERAAAGAAAERIRTRLKELGAREPAEEFRFSIDDPWSRQLLIALCRRYGLQPYRLPRMRRQTIVVKAPRSFVDATLWPEFQQINAALVEYLAGVTRRVIASEVFGGAGDVDDLPEQSRRS